MERIYTRTCQGTFCVYCFIIFRFFAWSGGIHFVKKIYGDTTYLSTSWRANIVSRTSWKLINQFEIEITWNQFEMHMQYSNTSKQTYQQNYLIYRTVSTHFFVRVVLLCSLSNFSRKTTEKNPWYTKLWIFLLFCMSDEKIWDSQCWLFIVSVK